MEIISFGRELAAHWFITRNVENCMKWEDFVNIKKSRNQEQSFKKQWNVYNQEEFIKRN